MGEPLPEVERLRAALSDAATALDGWLRYGESHEPGREFPVTAAILARAIEVLESGDQTGASNG